MDLTDKYDDLGGDDLLPGFVAIGSYDGKFYAAPYYSGSRLVFYRTDMYQKAGLSVPTIQRMEASDGNVRGVVDSLTKVVQALDLAGVDLIGEGAASPEGGRGVRLKSAIPKP